MTLLFGRLVQSFVTFSTATQTLDPNDTASEAALATAARDFKHQAALNASYLVYIGLLSLYPPPASRRSNVLHGV